MRVQMVLTAWILLKIINVEMGNLITYGMSSYTFNSIDSGSGLIKTTGIGSLVLYNVV